MKVLIPGLQGTLKPDFPSRGRSGARERGSGKPEWTAELGSYDQLLNNLRGILKGSNKGHTFDVVAICYDRCWTPK